MQPKTKVMRIVDVNKRVRVIAVIQLRIVLLHHCLLGNMEIAMCAVVQLLMGLFNGDTRLLTVHSPDTPQDILVHRQKSLVIKVGHIEFID